MKDFIGFFLILIGFIAISFGTAMINEWLSIIICGIYVTVLGIIVILSKTNNHRHE